MSKKILYCILFILFILLIIYATIYFVCEYILNEKKNYSSRVHTIADMIELKHINNKNFEDLKFIKASSVYGSISALSEKDNIDEYKKWCDYKNDNYGQDLINIIEKRVEIPYEINVKFLSGYEKLEKLCTDVKQ